MIELKSVTTVRRWYIRKYAYSAASSANFRGACFLKFEIVGEWLPDPDPDVLYYVMETLVELKIILQEILENLRELPVSGWVFRFQQ